MHYALILAGGTGSRAGGLLPKQFQMVDGRRILWRSVEAFHRFDPECRIIIVVHPDFLSQWDELFGEEEKELGFSIEKVSGGISRLESVRNGLKHISFSTENDKGGIVFIHDAARPLVTPELIARGASTLEPGNGAVPVVPVIDSLRHIGPDSSVSVSRSEYVAVQTPQVFFLSDILDAYESVEMSDPTLTDDASVAERFGLGIILFDGDPENIKITHPKDFKIFK